MVDENIELLKMKGLGKYLQGIMEPIFLCGQEYKHDLSFSKESKLYKI